MHTNMDFRHWLINLLIKILLVALLKMKTFLIKNQQKNYTNQLFENLIKEKYIQFLQTIFGAQIQQICSESVDLIKVLDFHYVIDIYSKYPWNTPLKDKKGITITNAFQKTLDESNHKPNKIWLDKGSEFYNTSMNS